MEVPLQITIRDMEHSDAVEKRIRTGADKLVRFHPRIISCRVVVEQASKHHHQGRLYAAHVDVRVPGGEEIVSTRHQHEDVYVAIRDAFDSASRQLEEVVREQRGDVKVHDTPGHGVVRRMVREEGYGFIEASDGREIYFGRDNVVHPSYEQLEPGTPVQFIEEWADEGLQAKRVTAGKHGASTG
jgi:ribosomal subunit interface protein